jgi:hypothetical protein
LALKLLLRCVDVRAHADLSELRKRRITRERVLPALRHTDRATCADCGAVRGAGDCPARAACGAAVNALSWVRRAARRERAARRRATADGTRPE